MYKVFNICGGIIYHGKDLKKAIDFAEQQFSSPYIHSAKGKRPVFNENVGKFGQSYDDPRCPSLGGLGRGPAPPEMGVIFFKKFI